jgi:hypothetical protein
MKAQLREHLNVRQMTLAAAAESHKQEKLHNQFIVPGQFSLMVPHKVSVHEDLSWSCLASV